MPSIAAKLVIATAITIVGMFAGDGPEARELSGAMQDAWTSFARSGDPAAPALLWPRYEPTTRATMVLGAARGAADDPFGEERHFWEQQLGRYGAGGPVEGVEIGRPLLESAGLWTEAPGDADGAVPSGAATGT